MVEELKKTVFETPVGVVLSDSTTLSCKMQIFEESERGNLREEEPRKRKSKGSRE